MLVNIVIIADNMLTIMHYLQFMDYEHNKYIDKSITSM